MDDLLAARSQMALSLGFHMIFATVGMGMPLLIVLAEGLWLRTHHDEWLELAHRWAKVLAILFAVGAVSGTVLSFELGLLWPTFMEHAGPVVGLPFSLEGFAFFFEAIAIGVWLYGWGRVPKLVHWLAAVVVWVSGTLSGVFVVCANAWMNTPTGFRVAEDGTFVDIDPVAAMLNPAAPGQVLHMVVAAVLASAWLVAGVHARELLRGARQVSLHKRALALALVVAGTTTVLQPLTGHVLAERVAHLQPVKFAALEGLWETTASAPLTLGGWVDEANERTTLGIEVPYALSFLATGDPHGEVRGLREFPPDERPPVLVTHVAYQVMLATAAGMGLTAAVAGALVAWRRRVPVDRWFLRLVVLTAPLGLVGIEAGWTTTEVGRQPWVVYGVLRTADAVTPMPGLAVPFALFTGLYVMLLVLTGVVLDRQLRSGGGTET